MTCMPRDTLRRRSGWRAALGLGGGCLLLALTAGTPLANAADAAAAADPGAAAPAAPAGPWSGSVSLGYLGTDGNSETTSTNFGFGVDYRINRWTHGVSGAAVGASENDETTAESYQLGWKSAYDLSERDYLFGQVNWLKDKFSGYDQQLSETVGYGRHVIVQPHQTLDLEIGPGARQSELRNGDEEKEAILHLGGRYQYLFNESAQFNFDVVVESGQENTFTEAVTALKTKLIGSLAAVLSYTVRNNTDVPDDTEETDTMTSVSLEYSF